MLQKNKVILYISRSQLILAEVDVRAEKVSELFKESWTLETLNSFIERVATTTAKRALRVIVGADLSHVVHLSIPKTTPESEERTYIYQEIIRQIPESVGENDWDHKVEAVTDQGKQVVVFVPVENIFAALIKALAKYDIAVEATEPEQVALTRNKNVFLGMAQKKDITGSDAKTLNIPLTSNSSVLRAAQHKGVTFGFLLILAFVLSVAVAYYFL